MDAVDRIGDVVRSGRGRGVSGLSRGAAELCRDPRGARGERVGGSLYGRLYRRGGDSLRVPTREEIFMGHIQDAKAQTRGISAAINGQSSAVQTLGNIGTDPHPERLLAVGLAHSANALSAVVAELGELRSEIEAMRRKTGVFRR